MSTNIRLQTKCIFVYLYGSAALGGALYAAPLQGERSVQDSKHQSLSHHLFLPPQISADIACFFSFHRPALCRRPLSKWITSSSKKSSQIPTSKKLPF